MAVTVIAAYDVAEDSRRARLAALLQTTGDRIQQSVFLLTVDRDTLNELHTRAAAIINPNEDSLYFFAQCADCWEALDNLGQAEPPRAVLYWAAL